MARTLLITELASIVVRSKSHLLKYMSEKNYLPSYLAWLLLYCHQRDITHTLRIINLMKITMENMILLRIFISAVSIFCFVCCNGCPKLLREIGFGFHRVGFPENYSGGFGTLINRRPASLRRQNRCWCTVVTEGESLLVTLNSVVPDG